MILTLIGYLKNYLNRYFYSKSKTPFTFFFTYYFEVDIKYSKYLKFPLSQHKPEPEYSMMAGNADTSDGRSNNRYVKIAMKLQ